jgi:hypothetical protein
MISPAALPRFIKGLHLNGTAARYFRTLAAMEFPKLNFENVGQAELMREAGSLRAKMRNQAAGPSRLLRQTEIYRIADWPFVFSALGTTEHGATLDEICMRTKLRSEVCLKILDQMKEHSVIKVESERYLPLSFHLIFSELSSEGAFKPFYRKTLQRAQHAATDGFLDPDCLHFASTFSVASKNLPALRKELQKLALRYVELHEEPLGDRIVSLAIALF